jgi:hypothetical protein
MNRRKFVEGIGLGSAFAWVACKLGATPTQKTEVVPMVQRVISQREVDREWARLGFPMGNDPHPIFHEMARGVLKRVDKP